MKNKRWYNTGMQGDSISSKLINHIIECEGCINGGRCDYSGYYFPDVISDALETLTSVRIKNHENFL